MTNYRGELMKSMLSAQALLLAAMAFGACGGTETSSQSQPKSAGDVGSEPGAHASTVSSTWAPSAESADQGPNTSSEQPARAGAEVATPTVGEKTAPAKSPDVIYVPTPQPVVDKMLELAKVKKSDVVYDLGCGDGRIVVTAAKRFGARAYGFDVDPARVAEARENVKANKVEDLVTIEQKDIFTLDLSPASVVTLYLLPELNVRLIPQLETLKSGARVVSHDFDMQGVTPVKHLSLKPEPGARDHEIYLWTLPLKKNGSSPAKSSGS
jgi:hypothetical protein